MKKLLCLIAKVGENIKKNWLHLLGLFFSTFIFLFSSSLLAIPFDNQVQREITQTITENAVKSKYELSLNSIELNPHGSSDFFIYSSNELQDFQMRNQQYDGIRSYAFAAYTPYNNKTSFNYSGFDCTSILIESKFQQDNFYFDLPLLEGSFPRTTNKQSAYISDSFANKIKGDKPIGDLIGKKLNGQSKTTSIEPISFDVIGILSTNNKLGNFLKAFFGDNLIFIPEYNSFQMNGGLFFVGSTDQSENKALTTFILDNYKSSSTASRNLESGYTINYKFYDYQNEKNIFSLGKSNDSINRIIEGYQGKSIVFGILGAILCISSFTLIIASSISKKNKASFDNKGITLFIYWLITCISLLINSLLYAFIPFMSIITSQAFVTRSTVVSTFIFLSWILVSGSLSFVPFFKKTTLNQKSRVVENTTN